MSLRTPLLIACTVLRAAGALGMSSCTWGEKNRFISVQFAGDKVMMFSGKGLK